MFKHASRLSEYRKPFGALPAESNVKLIFDTAKDSTDIVLCYSYGLYGFSYHEEPMASSATHKDRFVTELRLPSEAGLLFYWFRFTVPYKKAVKLLPDHEDRFRYKVWQESVMLYYVFDPDSKYGTGRIWFEPPRIGVDEEKYPYAWQITICDPDFKTPDFMKGALIYQIFPDRFNRGSKFDPAKFRKQMDRPERLLHEDWNEDVDIHGKPETGYLACDFYGGTLNGITEKLDYIKSLGINVIYLNPIFEARSSHRYDTADYLNVDPVLGSNDDFIRLSEEAALRGMKIVLDGVFSHTGADSRYFNKFDRYDGVGAYGSYRDGTESRYRSWYRFTGNDDGNITYESWWGFPDLPNVDEDDLSYRRFIFGEGGVVRTWLSRGASGFRLDVSDELPDSFIRQMRKTVREASDGNATVIGEVWEDASNKCSYGSYRDFMLGRTHDSVMGYTFRENLLSFLKGEIPAEVLDARMEGFRERYPAQAYYSMMNLISSHDVPRAVTVLTGDEDPGDREIQKDMKLTKEQRALGAKLMRLALCFQTGYIGSLCIYYGDEVLMEGYRDPFNRRTYPWEGLDELSLAQLSYVREVTMLREREPCLRTGHYKTLYASGGMLVFERFLGRDRTDHFGKNVGKGSGKIVLLINRDDTVFLRADLKTSEFSETSKGRAYKEPILRVSRDEERIIDVGPLSAVFVIYE